MKKFLLKTLVFVCLLILILAGTVLLDIFAVGGTFKNNYQASIVDKLDRLESITEPKIILVGHSNVSFGFDSARLEEEMGMPVVNLGLHGSLGNSFHENLAKVNLGAGDIVVVCHTSFSDDGLIGDYSLAWITVDNNKRIADLIEKRDYRGMLEAYPDYLCNSLFLWATGRANRDTGSCYSRNAFNGYGDIVLRPEDMAVTEEYFKTASVGVPEITEDCMNRFNEFVREVNDKGASVVIAGYPIAYGEYSDFTAEDFDDFEQKLRKYAECDVISKYSDYFFPYSYFYNTQLHLTEEGAAVRTDLLASDLKAWLNYRNK